jgi:hypothetical protein
MRRLVLSTVVVLLSACGPAIPLTKPYAPEVKLKVPWEPNLGATCFSSSFAMVMRYWGKAVTVADVVRLIGPAPFAQPHPRDRLAAWMKHNHGLEVIYLQSTTFAHVKAYVNEGYPVIVLQKFSLRNPEGHNRVVTGYSDARRVVIVNDPSPLGGDYEIDYEVFERLWTYDHRPTHWPGEAYLVIPADRRAGVARSTAH